MNWYYRCCLLFIFVIFAVISVRAQGKRKIIIDQDAAGPGGTDMQAILTLINSQDTNVLGITIPTGDAWRDEEVQHTLRLLEIIGRTDIPVLPGAEFPLVSSKEYIAKWETLYGKVVYQGAWNYAKRHPVHGPYEIPPVPEGTPTTKASTEDAAHFMVRTVHQYPHDVTIYAAGPMTDLALAIALDPHFTELTKELIVMGGSINPQTDDPEFALTPKREFNFWMDPEASRAVLHAHWPRIVLTTVDISVKTRMEKSLIAQVAKSQTPAAQYVAKYAEANYLWDELAAAAWLDHTIITKSQKLYIDVQVDHGASYGDTLAWAPGQQPGMGEQLVEVQQDLDKEKFYKEYVELLSRPTPNSHPGSEQEIARLVEANLLPPTTGDALTIAPVDMPDISCSVVEWKDGPAKPTLAVLCPPEDVFAPLHVYLKLSWLKPEDVPSSARSLTAPAKTHTELRMNKSATWVWLGVQEKQGTPPRGTWVAFNGVADMALLTLPRKR